MAKPKKEQTRAQAFMSRMEKLAARVEKDTPEGARLLLAIREGLLAPEPGRGRGGSLDGAIHSMRLVAMHADEDGRCSPESAKEPESLLVYLASAFERIERIVLAVERELEQAEQDIARRRGSRRAA